MSAKKRQVSRADVANQAIGASAAVGLVYGCITVLAFGSIAGPWYLHLIIMVVGPLFVAAQIPTSVVLRQLMLPGCLGGTIYGSIKLADPYTAVVLGVLGILMMLAIGLTEAYLVTGKLSDAWRSYLFDPGGWQVHFGIETELGE